MIMASVVETWSRQGRWTLLIGVLCCLWGPGSSISFENKTDSSSGRVHIFSPRMEYNEWTPLDRGDPLKNNPTFDYVPPVLDRVQYWLDSHTTEPSTKRDVLVLGVTAKKASQKIPEQILQDAKFLNTRTSTRVAATHDPGHESFFKGFTGSAGAEPPKLLRATNFRSDLPDFKQQNGLQIPAASYYQRPANFYKSKPYPVVLPFQKVEQPSSFKVSPKDKVKFDVDPVRDFQLYGNKNSQRLPFPQRQQLAGPSKFGFKGGFPVKDTKNYPPSSSSVSFEKSNLVYQSSQVFSGNWPESGSPFTFESNQVAISNPNHFGGSSPSQFGGQFGHSSPNRFSSLPNPSHSSGFSSQNQFNRPQLQDRPNDPDPNDFVVHSPDQLGASNSDPFDEADHHASASTHTEIIVKQRPDGGNFTKNESASESKSSSNVTTASMTEDEGTKSTMDDQSAKMYIVIANTSSSENETMPVIVMPEHYKKDSNVRDTSKNSGNSKDRDRMRLEQISSSGERENSDVAAGESAGKAKTELSQPSSQGTVTRQETSFSASSPTTTMMMMMKQQDNRAQMGMDFGGSLTSVSSNPSVPSMSANPFVLSMSAIPPNPSVSSMSSSFPSMSSISPTPFNPKSSIPPRQTMSLIPPPPMPFQHLSPPMPNLVMVPPPKILRDTSSNPLAMILQATTSKEPSVPDKPRQDFLFTPTPPSVSAIVSVPTKHTASIEEMGPPQDSSSTKSLAEESTTTLAPTVTTAVSLTTDPIFSHYKQPAKPIHGHMYLIIQGHSKVKTYKPIDKYSRPVDDNGLS